MATSNSLFLQKFLNMLLNRFELNETQFRYLQTSKIVQPKKAAQTFLSELLFLVVRLVYLII